MIQTVDLASKQSAVVIRERGGEVHHQFDSLDLSPFAFAREVGVWGRRCEATVIEDVPFNPNYTQAMVKPVFRLQGILFAVLHPVLDQTFLLDPSAWMKMFPGVQRAPKGLTKTAGDAARVEAARVHALNRGYSPPDLVAAYVAEKKLHEGENAKILKKHTNPLEKSMTDYVSAFLMSEFVFSFDRIEDFAAAPSGVTPAYI